MRSFDLVGFAAHLARLPVLVAIEQHAALEHAAQLVEKRAKDKFGEYQQAAGPFVGWAELADSTKADRVAHGYSENNPLLRDGSQRASIGHRADVNEAVVGSDSQVMVYLELGTSKMPPRSTLGGAAVESAHEVVEILGAGVVAALVGNQVFNKRLPVI